METLPLNFLTEVVLKWGGWGAFFVYIIIEKLQKRSERNRLIEVIVNNTTTMQAIGGRVNDIYGIVINGRGTPPPTNN